MPLKHTRTFRIRYYECDANSHLNNTNYLRLMQEAAFDASAAAGYGLERYQAMGRFWLIRESQVDFLRPLHYNDVVHVTTWISDFRRVTSRRVYEFHLESSGELIAQASTDWVFMDAISNMPTGIPAQLVKDFYPEGAPTSFPPRTPFPKPPPPPPATFHTPRKVAWQDIDGMNHVNNAMYMNYVSEAAFQVVAAFGWPWERMTAAGFGIFIRRLRIQYLQPALLNDDLDISTWGYGVKRAMADRHYLLNRVSDGALLCQANTLGVWVDLQSGQPIRIPKEFLADLQPNISSDES
jgi:acyl-CoA thioester hydrolase